MLKLNSNVKLVIRYAQFDHLTSAEEYTVFHYLYDKFPIRTIHQHIFVPMQQIMQILEGTTQLLYVQLRLALVTDRLWLENHLDT